MPRWMIRSQSWAVAYFADIVLFAVVYALLPPGTFNRPLSVVDTIYFSIITITTVGFGDILAKTDAGKVIVSLQATTGVVLVGLFLAALWRDFTALLEGSQAAQAIAALRKVHLATFFAYWRYIETTIADYRAATAEATKPLAQRQDVQEYDPAFRFSDMRDVLGATVGLHAGRIRPLLVRYFDIEGQLANDLKYLLTNYAITEFPEVRDLVIRFLALVRSPEIRDSLLAIHDESLQAELHDTIAAHDGGPNGTRGRQPALIGTLVDFAAGIRKKMRVLEQLEAVVGRLTQERADDRGEAHAPVASLERRSPTVVPSAIRDRRSRSRSPYRTCSALRTRSRNSAR